MGGQKQEGMEDGSRKVRGDSNTFGFRVKSHTPSSILSSKFRERKMCRLQGTSEKMFIKSGPRRLPVKGSLYLPQTRTGAAIKGKAHHWPGSTEHAHCKDIFTKNKPFLPEIRSGPTTSKSTKGRQAGVKSGGGVALQPALNLSSLSKRTSFQETRNTPFFPFFSLLCPTGAAAHRGKAVH